MEAVPSSAQVQNIFQKLRFINKVNQIQCLLDIVQEAMLVSCALQSTDAQLEQELHWAFKALLQKRDVLLASNEKSMYCRF